jgi:hypothetical protein
MLDKIRAQNYLCLVGIFVFDLFFGPCGFFSCQTLFADYAAVIKLPSGEFQRVVRDLSQFGESVVICVTKVIHSFILSFYLNYSLFY